MLMLTLGVLLWSVAHLFKRLAPSTREGMGDLGKLVVTVALIGSVVMMISGYQGASGPVWWVRQPFWTSISNVLMLLAFYLMVASSLTTTLLSPLTYTPFDGSSLSSHLALGSSPNRSRISSL